MALGHSTAQQLNSHCLAVSAANSCGSGNGNESRLARATPSPAPSIWTPPLRHDFGRLQSRIEITIALISAFCFVVSAETFCMGNWTGHGARRARALPFLRHTYRSSTAAANPRPRHPFSKREELTQFRVASGVCTGGHSPLLFGPSNASRTPRPSKPTCVSRGGAL